MLAIVIKCNILFKNIKVCLFQVNVTLCYYSIYCLVWAYTPPYPIAKVSAYHQIQPLLFILVQPSRTNIT